MSKIERLKEWSESNIEILGEDTIKIVDAQIKLWSEQKSIPIKKDFYTFGEIYNIEKYRDYDSNAESIFAKRLNERGINFKSQYPIGLYETKDGQRRAKYWLDFLIENYLNIEIDGEIWHDKEKDKKRDEYLEKIGYTIFRYPSTLVYFDVDSIIDVIEGFLNIAKIYNEEHAHEQSI